MTRFSIDTDGVSRERLAVAQDPGELRESAATVALATATAIAAVGTEGGGIGTALARFRAVHAYALDALADAADALGDRLDRSTLQAREVELFVTAGLARVSAVGPPAPGISVPSGGP